MLKNSLTKLELKKIFKAFHNDKSGEVFFVEDWNKLRSHLETVIQDKIKDHKPY
jgi:hypothetical protein